MPLNARPGHGDRPSTERQPWPISTRPGTHGLRHRRATDGTIWCATCNRTLAPTVYNQVFCRDCTRRRDALRKDPDQPDLRAVDWRLLEPFLQHIEELEDAFGAAFAPWERHRRVRPDALDALFIAVKNVLSDGGTLYDDLR